MPRSKEITLNEKTHTIKEFRVKELEKLLASFKEDFDVVTKIKTVADLQQVAGALLRTKLPVLVPTLTLEDIDDAYPSEIEACIEGFIEVNFTGLRKLVGQLFSLAHVASR